MHPALTMLILLLTTFLLLIGLFKFFEEEDKPLWSIAGYIERKTAHASQSDDLEQEDKF